VGTNPARRGVSSRKSLHRADRHLCFLTFALSILFSWLSCRASCASASFRDPSSSGFCSDCRICGALDLFVAWGSRAFSLNIYTSRVGLVDADARNSDASKHGILNPWNSPNKQQKQGLSKARGQSKRRPGIRLRPRS